MKTQKSKKRIKGNERKNAFIPFYCSNWYLGKLQKFLADFLFFC